jgi:predicted Zn-dependent protease
MKRIIIIIMVTLIGSIIALPQQKATVKEYNKVFKTYPFSDPNPIPQIEPHKKFGKLYPYFRYEGYTTESVEREWKVVVLENDYLKIMILPEIGGKVWSMTEKSSGLSVVYDNKVIKFRDIGIRGPWTKGGLEFNYGIYGHNVSCGTPVDYNIVNKPDGSVSCVIGFFELLTKTSWRVDINLPKDKAYCKLSSFWYNSSSIEQPYYSWYNIGVKADGNLKFIFPGTKWIQHDGEVYSWPYDENGRDISYYENNDFGGYKSYHVLGEYSDFFGGYWLDDDFGMCRYTTRDDNVGKKLWISGLSGQGMIFERILTDNGGQSIEFQSGRLFNQSWPESSFTPFKHKGFMPHTTDLWTEYLFPVVKTKGIVAANNFGILNLIEENGWLKIYFSPLQKIQDSLIITLDNKTIYSKMISLRTLELFTDSIRINKGKSQFQAVLGDKKLEYTSPAGNVLNRPVKSPDNFDWNSVYGLYLQGEEYIRDRKYVRAEEKIRDCLGKDPNYLPALTKLSMLLYRSMQYPDALSAARKALSIDAYAPEANYYYGLINNRLGNVPDAKDGFEIASLDMGYRSASYSMLAGLYLSEKNIHKSIEYARKSTGFNHYAVNANQLLAVSFRLLKNKKKADEVLDTLLTQDPLNHFARFERYLWDRTVENKAHFTSLIRNELPRETYLELAIWYYNAGRKEEAAELLKMAPENAEVSYWLAFLTDQPLDNSKLDPGFVFPYRKETFEILKKLSVSYDHWLLKYHLALINWNLDNMDDAYKLFSECGDLPDYPPFYAARADFYYKIGKKTEALKDLKNAAQLDENQWRYGGNLIAYYLSEKEDEKALDIGEQYYKKFPDNYNIGLLYIRSLINNGLYRESGKILKTINVLPYENATMSKKLYNETYLMMALEEMKKDKFRKALTYINIARQWPENLGVGKPYDSDIDERLEDWLAYECYTKLGDDTAAWEKLDKILSFKPQKTAYINTFSSANNLVSAWALRLSGKTEEAEKYLGNWSDREPENSMAQWAIKIFNGTSCKLHENAATDENYRVLNRFIHNNSIF